jgi:hypothetical protein
MSICERNHEILESYVFGLCDLDQFDHIHARWCPDCRAELKRSRATKRLLDEYAREMDREAESVLAGGETVCLSTPPTRKEFRFRNPPAWLAVAASLVIVVLVSYFYFRAAPARIQTSPYLGSIQAETARVEVLEYLGRTQLFLLSLFDGSSGCADGEAGGGPEREFARRLIYQKKLLEPRLVSPDFEDLRPILDELELFLLDIATRDGCLEDRELRSWKDVLDSRSTFTKLKLLQMEGRI